MRVEISGLQRKADIGRAHISKVALEPNQRKEPLDFSAGRAAELLDRTTASIGQVLNRLNLAEGIDLEAGRYSIDQAKFAALREHYEGPTAHTPARILTVSNQKGGVGKTTTVVHLAPYLALKGYRVLVVDGDSQGSYSSYQSLVPDRDLAQEQTIAPLLTDERDDAGAVIPLKTIVENIIRKSPNIENLWFIPACLELANADVAAYQRQFSSTPGDHYSFFNRLYLGLDSVRDHFDFIIIDCPPHISPVTWNCVYAADMVLVPVGAHMLDFSSTMRFVDWMDLMVNRLPTTPLSRVRFLITNYDKRPSSEELTGTVKAVFGDTVMKNFVLHSSEVQRASAELKSLYELGKRVGSKDAYVRACRSMDAVNKEILENLLQVKPYPLAQMETDRIADLAAASRAERAEATSNA